MLSFTVLEAQLVQLDAESGLKDFAIRQAQLCVP